MLLIATLKFVFRKRGRQRFDTTGSIRYLTDSEDEDETGGESSDFDGVRVIGAILIELGTF